MVAGCHWIVLAWILAVEEAVLVLSTRTLPVYGFLTQAWIIHVLWWTICGGFGAWITSVESRGCLVFRSIGLTWKQSIYTGCHDDSCVVIYRCCQIAAAREESNFSPEKWIFKNLIRLFFREKEAYYGVNRFDWKRYKTSSNFPFKYVN